jgi:hypothetical protein
MTIKPFIGRIREYYNTHWYASLIIIFSILIVTMLLEVKNHRFRSSDFKVYHRAAERLLNGENLYRPDIDGHYYYKYSPTAAVYFIPSGMLPVQLAKVLHWIVMALLATLGFYLALLMVRPGFQDDNPRYINNMLLLIGLIVSVHLEVEFYLGQVNHILFVFFLAMIILAERKKYLPASIIWAATIYLKPFGLIFLPYFLIKKRFKLVFYFLIFTALLALAPLPFTGVSNFSGQYQHWFHEMSVEMAWKQSLLADANDTIFSLLARYTPLRMLDFTPVVTRIFQLIILAAIGFIFLYMMYRGRKLKNSYALEAGFLIALIPVLSFTNYYAFQFIELAVFCIVFNYRRLSKWWRIIAIAGFVLTAMNMHDLWGEKLFRVINNLSIVGIGAIIIQSVMVNLRLRNDA